MTFEKLVPGVYYHKIGDGLTFFCDCLKFTIAHDEIAAKEPFCVLQKAGLQLLLFANVKLAREHNPEYRLVTKNIDEVYEEISGAHPEFLHPNLPKVTLRSWGAKEFSVRDEQVCVIMQQW